MSYNRASGLRQVLTLLVSRTEVIFFWSWCTFIACMVVGKGTPPLDLTVKSVLSTMLAVISVYVYNDLMDRDMDALNQIKNTRPLAARTVDAGIAKAIIAVAGTLGLSLAWTINFGAFASLLVYWVVFMLYSYPGVRLKKMFIVKELVTAGGWPLLSLVGSYGVTGGFQIQAIYAGLAFGAFSFLGLPALSDSFDEKEDALYGVKSLCRAISWRRRVQLLGVAILMMMTTTPLLYRSMGFSVIFPVGVIVMSLILLRWGVYPIWGQFETAAALNSRKLFAIYVVATQVMLILGSSSWVLQALG